MILKNKLMANSSYKYQMPPATGWGAHTKTGTGMTVNGAIVTGGSNGAVIGNWVGLVALSLRRHSRH